MKADFHFLVLPNITEKLPTIGFKASLVDCPPNIKLADEQFSTPKNIDVLLGASIFYDLLKSGRIRLGKNERIILQETVLGWILAGTIYINLYEPVYNKTVCNFIMESSSENLNETLTKFWQTEEIPEKQHMSREEIQCETYFKNTMKRSIDG